MYLLYNNKNKNKYSYMEILKLVDGIGYIMPQDDLVSLQINDVTTISIYISLDGYTYVPLKEGISIDEQSIINLTDCQIGIYIKVVSSNDIEIKYM